MTSHSDPALEVHELSVRYGSHVALREINFQVEAGRFVAVLGPNGSGKTSLIKALLGILPGASGTVRIFGMHPADIERGRIGYVPQVKTLERRFPAIALELVISGVTGRWPARRRREEVARATDALERVGASRLAPRQLSTLSGGELQRVFLARSLAREPDVLLMDEPTAGVDVAGAGDLYDLLESYQKAHGATIVMVTHDWNVAYHHATHALILNRAQISFGPSHEVLSERNLRKAFGHVGHAHAMFWEDPDDARRHAEEDEVPEEDRGAGAE